MNILQYGLTSIPGLISINKRYLIYTCKRSMVCESAIPNWLNTDSSDFPACTIASLKNAPLIGTTLTQQMQHNDSSESLKNSGE